MPQPQIDNTAVKQPLHPDDYFWLGKDSDGFWIRTQKHGPDGTVGKHESLSPELDVMVINPFYCGNQRFNAKGRAFHETLHRGFYGERGPISWPDNLSVQQMGEISDRLTRTYNFKNWKINKLIDQKFKDVPIALDPMKVSGVSKDYWNYITSPYECGVHIAEMGYANGLTPGQPYPGKTEALKVLAKIANKDRRLYIYNWQNKPKRVWDALTGKYFMLPIIGAGSAAAITATQKPEEQQIL